MAEHFLDVKGVSGSSPDAPTMSTIFFISIFVSLFSLGLVVVGIPAQIVKNYKEKR